jgi:hypothetical protein
VEQGGWGDREAERVIIPATMGVDGGIWYRIRDGVQGLLVRDERDAPVVFVLVEPASHYYQIMTRSVWMPVLVGRPVY